MICLNSPKSSEFAICLTNSGQKSLTMFMLPVSTTFQLNFKYREIRKYKLRLRWNSNRQSLGVETTEHLRSRMRKENCRKRL